MDVLKVVQQLRDLAADPQNRATIVRDQGCLPGLVIFLDNDNPAVVLTALEALYYLAQVPSNRPLMKNEVGLLISVRRLLNRPATPPKLRGSAQKLYDVLFPPAGLGRALSQPRARPGARSNAFLGPSNRKAKLVVLLIAGIRDKELKQLAEEQLLGAKGVVSFTFNTPSERCFVRVHSDVKPELLCRVVDQCGVLRAQHVVKNAHGEEVLLTYGDNPAATVQDEKENAKPLPLPDYLPEESEAAKERAIERSGAVEGGGGWFSSVSSFLSKTLYW